MVGDYLSPTTGPLPARSAINRSGENHKDTKSTKIRNYLCILCVFVVLFPSIYDHASIN
jgi:hypothetical protein